MDKFNGKLVFGTFYAAMLPIVSVLLGYWSGWMVSLLFDDTIHHVVRVVFATSRFDNVTLAQFGATAAFFTAWIKPVHYTSRDETK